MSFPEKPSHDCELRKFCFWWSKTLSFENDSSSSWVDEVSAVPISCRPVKKPLREDQNIFSISFFGSFYSEIDSSSFGFYFAEKKPDPYVVLNDIGSHNTESSISPWHSNAFFLYSADLIAFIINTSSVSSFLKFSSASSAHCFNSSGSGWR